MKFILTIMSQGLKANVRKKYIKQGKTLLRHGNIGKDQSPKREHGNEERR